MVMDVLLQELMVTSAPFSVTMLLLCAARKPGTRNHNLTSHRRRCRRHTADHRCRNGRGVHRNVVEGGRGQRGGAVVAPPPGPTYTFCPMGMVWAIQSPPSSPRRPR